MERAYPYGPRQPHTSRRHLAMSRRAKAKELKPPGPATFNVQTRPSSPRFSFGKSLRPDHIQKMAGDPFAQPSTVLAPHSSAIGYQVESKFRSASPVSFGRSTRAQARKASMLKVVAADRIGADSPGPQAYDTTRPTAAELRKKFGYVPKDDNLGRPIRRPSTASTGSRSPRQRRGRFGKPGAGFSTSKRPELNVGKGDVPGPAAYNVKALGFSSRYLSHNGVRFTGSSRPSTALAGSETPGPGHYFCSAESSTAVAERATMKNVGVGVAVASKTLHGSIFEKHELEEARKGAIARITELNRAQAHSKARNHQVFGDFPNIVDKMASLCL